MESRPQQAEYMNAQGLAVHLGVTERTVRRWIKSGELAGEKRGRAYMIRREDGERMRLGGLGQVVDDRSALVRELVERDRAFAVLQGRYAEIEERNRQLEHVLHEERRRAALAEARLELGSATAVTARRAA